MVKFSPSDSWQSVGGSLGKNVLVVQVFRGNQVSRVIGVICGVFFGFIFGGNVSGNRRGGGDVSRFIQVVGPVSGCRGGFQVDSSYFAGLFQYPEGSSVDEP